MGPFLLVLTVVLTTFSVLQFPLPYDDDVIRFLPEGDPEVDQLMAIAEQFGSIHVALVGVEVTDGDRPGNLYEPENLLYVRALHQALEGLIKTDVVAHVTSITELGVAELGEDEHNRKVTVHRDVVPSVIPTDLESLNAIREGILRLDYLVGSVVSEDGSSTRLILQLRVGTELSVKQAAEQVRAVVEGVPRPSGVKLHYAGAPFIAEAAANGSQRDLRRLAPWICLIIVLLIVWSLGSIMAALLAMMTVALGIVWTLGLMGALGQPFTLVSTSLPVILVALGSAYAVHLLVWYLDHDDGVGGMLHNVGWPVVVTALTTMAGFGSFLVMDLPPMREFGWQMALGTGICALVALVLIPAVLVWLPSSPREPTQLSLWLDGRLVSLAGWSRRNRRSVFVLFAVLVTVFAARLGHIETRMDISSFFEEGSPPHQADIFMTDHFGGAVFLQVLIEGDIHEPAVLRQMANFEDRIRSISGVTRVESITNVLSLVNEAIGEGRRHIATNRRLVEEHGELALRDSPAVSLLVSPEWKGALIQVAIGGFDTGVVRRVTAEIRSLAKEHLADSVVVVPRSDGLAALQCVDAAEQILSLSSADLPTEQLAQQLQRDIDGDWQAWMQVQAGSAPAALRDGFREVLAIEIGRDEMLLVREGTELRELADTMAEDVRQGAFGYERALNRFQAIVDPEELEDGESFGRGVRYVFDRLVETGERVRNEQFLPTLLTRLQVQDIATKARISAIVSDLMQAEWVVRGDRAPNAERRHPMVATVSGYPIVQEAFTRSVKRNQINSLLTCMPLIFLLMVLLFRSVRAGLVGMVPTLVTLLVTFGLMGWFNESLPLDIGSSMLASIALGVGIDYAIHFLWRYRVAGLDGAMRNTGRAIVINAAEITAGFVVLVGATIVPMSNFGLLTAETLFTAAVATLVLMPAMVGWWKPNAAHSQPGPSDVANAGSGGSE